MNREVVKTNDNSSTLYVPALQQHYHSLHGAIQESQHVFIEAGLHQFKDQREISILEIGLGTGLNALLTLLEAGKLGLKVHYTALEKYPLSLKEMLLLNYGAQLGSRQASRHLTDLHQVLWGKWIDLTPFFSIRKLETDFKDFRASSEFDLIYFDAFAPDAQPDLWTESIFESMYHGLKSGGMLVTYCVKGAVRRNMMAAGFEVEKIPGPPGKREMARARKP